MADEQTTPAGVASTAAAQDELADITTMLADVAETPAPKAAPSDETETPRESPESKRVEPEKKPEPAKDNEPKTAGEAWKQARAEKKAAQEDRRRTDERARELTAKEQALDAKLRDHDAFKAKADLLDRLVAGDYDAFDAAGLDFNKLSKGYIENTTDDKKLSRVERELEALKKQRADDDAKAREDGDRATTERKLASARKLVIDEASKHDILKHFDGNDVVTMANAIGTMRTEQKLPLFDNVPDLFAAIVTQLRAEQAARAKALGEAPPTSGASAAARPPTTISQADTKVRGPQTAKPFNPDDELAEIQADLAAAGFGRR